jgi:hypothetical protein
MENNSRQPVKLLGIVSQTRVGAGALHIFASGRKAYASKKSAGENCLPPAVENKNLVSLTRILCIRSLERTPAALCRHLIGGP